MQLEKNEVYQQANRTAILRTLCILSSVGIALSLSRYIGSYFSYKTMNALNAGCFLVMAIFELVILVGVLLMWKLKKSGFYIYLIGQIASGLYPFVTGTVDTVMGLLTLPLVVVSIVFIILYGRQLKYMY